MNDKVFYLSSGFIENYKMAKKLAKKTTTQQSAKKSVTTKEKTAKKVTGADVSSKRKSIRVSKASKTSKAAIKKTISKKKNSPSDKIKFDSHSRDKSESSGLEGLDKILYSKSRKESESLKGSKAEDVEKLGSQDKKTTSKRKPRAVKKGAPQVEQKTDSGAMKSKSPQNTSQESYLKQSAKQQMSGKVDSQSISDELSKLMKKVEMKVSKKSPPKSSPSNSRQKQKITAKKQNYSIQKNPRSTKFTPVVDIFELAKKNEYNNTDIILAIMELAHNTNGYVLPSSPTSNSFWEEIVQFKEVKRLFQFFRPETLKKYWRYLNYRETYQVAILLIKKYKKLLEEKKPK